jgi:hypothetical protein
MPQVVPITATTTVVVNALPTAGITVAETSGTADDGTVCAGSAITLTATGGTSYNWTLPNTSTSTTNPQSIASAVAADAGTYTVTVTNAAGCANTATTTVVVNALPTAGITVAETSGTADDGTVCAGSAITLTATGGTSYNWTLPNTSTSTTNPQSIASAVAADAGTYTVTVTNAAGCANTATTTVVVNALPTAGITVAETSGTADDGTVCAGSAITLTATGGTSYNWTLPNTSTSTTNPQSIASAVAADAGTYTVTVTNAAGCANTATTTVVVNALPTFTGTASCSGGANTGSISQTATGGNGTYTYDITGGSFGATLANGTYNVTVTSNACSTTSNVVVNCADLCPDLTAVAPAVQVTESTCTSCMVSGGAITAPATTCPAGSTLQYSTDNGTSWSTILPTYNQTSAITVLTRCNCNVNTATSSPTSSVTTVPGTCTTPSAPTGTLAIVNSTCTSCMVSGGSIGAGTVTGTGGTVEYSTDGGTTWSASLPTYAAPQTIMASVLGTNGCRSASTTVGTTVAGTCTTPSAPTGTLAIVNSTCTSCMVSGGSIGAGTVTGTGGTVEYSTDGGTTWSASLPTYAAPQTIMASVLGTNGCRSASTTVGTTVAGTCTTPSAPTGTLAIVNSTCGTGCTVSGGSIGAGTVTGTGGTVEYSTDGGTTWSASLPTYAAPQTIMASVLGTNGCRSTSATVGTTVAGTCTTPAFTSSSVSLCVNATRTLAASPAGGTFSLVSGAATVVGTTLTATGAGAIVVQYTATNGCTITQNITATTCGTRTITISDPCSCNNNATTLTNGTFNETVELSGLITGDVLTVTAISGLYASAGVAYTTATATGALLVTLPTAHLSGIHTDNVGYSITVHVSNTTPGFEFEGDYSVGNKCAYPEPDFTLPVTPICNNASPITLTATHTDAGPAGVGVFSGAGVSGTTFTPSVAGVGGPYTITLTYTGGNDGLGGVSPDGGTVPAYPGCVQPISKTITVIDCCGANPGTWVE